MSETGPGDRRKARLLEYVIAWSIAAMVLTLVAVLGSAIYRFVLGEELTTAHAALAGAAGAFIFTKLPEYIARYFGG